MLDHLVYATPHGLDAAVEDLTHRLGVRASAGGRHVGAGTHNALLSLSEGTYLEIIAPDTDQPRPRGPRPYGIDLLTSPRLVTWMAKAGDIDAQVQAARGAGFALSDTYAMSRALPDGSLLSWRLATAQTSFGDGLLPGLIEWHTVEQHPARTAARGCSLITLRGQHPQPERLQPVLDALGLDLQLERADAATFIARLQTPSGAVELC